MAHYFSTFSKKQEKEYLTVKAEEESVDFYEAYFKDIKALSGGRSREWEIEVGKQIDEGRVIITRSLCDFRMLLKRIAKKDRSARSILNALRNKLWMRGTVGSERFCLLEKAFSEIQTILRINNDFEELNFCVKTEKQFHAGREIFEKARNTLVEKNLFFAVFIVKKHFNSRIGLNFFDVIEEANIGLMKAAERYRYKRGYRFITYASWWIRQTITRAYANKSRDIRIPAHKHELQQKISQAEKNICQHFVGALRREEVAKKLGITIEAVLENEVIFKTPYSIDDAQMPNMEGICLKDVIPDDAKKNPEALCVTAECAVFIKQIMKQVLTPRERLVLQKRFGFDGESDKKFRDLGRMMNLSYERVRQIQNEAIAKLRSPEVLEKLKLVM